MRFLALAIASAVLGLLPATTALGDDLKVAEEPTPPAKPAPTVASAPPPKVAGAPPVKPKAPDSRPTRSLFYGWQNILVGELGLAAAVGGAFIDAGEPAGLGGLVYLFGGPIVHGAHGGGAAKIFASLGGNIGFPLLGALTGFAATSDDDDSVGEGIAVGVLAGCAFAPIFDGLVLGHETKPVDDKVGAPRKPGPPMVGVSRTKHGWTATVAGAF